MNGLCSCCLQEAHFLNLCAIKQIQIHFHILPFYLQNRNNHCLTKCSRKDWLSLSSNEKRHRKDLNIYKIKRSCQKKQPHNWSMSYLFTCIYWPIFFRILTWFSGMIYIFCIYHHCGVHNSNVHRGTRWQCWICIFTLVVKILVMKTFLWNGKFFCDNH